MFFTVYIFYYQLICDFYTKYFGARQMYLNMYIKFKCKKITFNIKKITSDFINFP